MRLGRLTTALLGLALLLAGHMAQAQMVFHRGHGAAPATLDPHLNFGARDAFIQDDLFEGLVATAADGAIIPGAAESWDISPDGTVYTFHLRPGLKWSNGDPLVAADFVAGIRRTLAPETASEKAYYFFNVIRLVNAAAYNAGEVTDPAQVGVAAPDDRTVVLTFERPAPNALYLLNSFQTAPLHGPSFAALGERFTRPGNMVSNGAYTLTELVPQSHLVLTKNPNYWDAANVAPDEVWYHVTEDEAAELRRYRAGELDTTSSFPVEDTERLRAEFGDEVRVMQDTFTNYLSFNITVPPLDDIRVRQALSLAINREVLQRDILRSGFEPLYSYVPTFDPDYPNPVIPDRDMTPAAREEQARALFAEAGFGPDNPLELEILSTNEALETREALAVAAMWQRVLGVRTSFRNVEFQAWLDAFYAGDWQVFNDNFVADYPRAESYLTYMAPSTEAGYAWESPEYDALLEQAMNTTDVPERNRLLAEAERQLLDSYILAPISGGASRHLVKSHVRGWTDNIIQSHPSRFLSLAE